ncbi:conserved hypothetical protein [Trichodesmium erythraeum IMS101]|uniref:Tc1-like transposase DDE domain-containing protein n=1 Tax=Trichodesmium erythraeum (strain IMS101) TaxID=203124 RepID=Q10ZW5_TRIEI
MQKKSLYASEQDTPRVQELRHDYRRWLDKIDVRNLVFVDEARINLSMSRLFARAVDGERAVGSIPGSKGGNVSLIGALNLDGLIASMTVPGSTNTEVFITLLNPGLTTDLSPIELCWSKLKQFLRSCEARTHESLEQAMAEVVNFITEDDAFGWFNHCGLFT